MTAQDMIEILSLLPPDTVLLMDIHGDFIPPCFVDSELIDLESEDLPQNAFVISPCFCGDEDFIDEESELTETEMIFEPISNVEFNLN